MFETCNPLCRWWIHQQPDVIFKICIHCTFPSFPPCCSFDPLTAPWTSQAILQMCLQQHAFTHTQHSKRTSLGAAAEAGVFFSPTRVHHSVGGVLPLWASKTGNTQVEWNDWNLYLGLEVTRSCNVVLQSVTKLCDIVGKVNNKLPSAF